MIPNNDLSGGGSGNPNFFTFGGPSGLVTVTADFIFPGFRQHTTGVSTSASANAAGGVVGVPVPPFSPGNIGTNQNVTIDISH